MISLLDNRTQTSLAAKLACPLSFDVIISQSLSDLFVAQRFGLGFGDSEALHLHGLLGRFRSYSVLPKMHSFLLVVFVFFFAVF